MSSNPTLAAEGEVLLSGLGIGESPRWHDGRLWFCNWGMQEVVAVDLQGHREVMARVPTSIPFCIDARQSNADPRRISRQAAHGLGYRCGRQPCESPRVGGSGRWLPRWHLHRRRRRGLVRGCSQQALRARPRERRRAGGHSPGPRLLACALGGADRRVLLMMAAEWHGFPRMAESFGTGQILAVEVPAPGVGWP